MANEAVIVNDLNFPAVDFTCAAGTAITKGAILTLTDPRTVATVSDTPSANGYICAGIAAADKSSSDGKTNLAVHLVCIADLKASGAITAGFPIKSCGTNFVKQAVAADAASGSIMGKALETATDGEVIECLVMVGSH